MILVYYLLETNFELLEGHNKEIILSNVLKNL